MTRVFNVGPRSVLLVSAILFCTACTATRPSEPCVMVLGTAQDGGAPQAGRFSDPRWDQPARMRMVTCLGVIDPRSERRWMIDATPDFRRQLLDLQRASGGPSTPPLHGIFLTHAHIGHYTGLMFLGHESMGAKSVPVWAMPKMSEFLQANGPWNQLVRLENISLQPLTAGTAVQLADGLSITPFLVPHRQEYSEVVGFRIQGPTRAVLFIPDIDAWEQWDTQGTRIEDVVRSVDVAYLDGTFFDNGEIPGRDMTGFPHPFIRHSMRRFASLPASERNKIRFIHLNHTNPAQSEDSAAAREVIDAGMHVAEQGEMQLLGETQLLGEMQLLGGVQSLDGVQLLGGSASPFLSPKVP